MKNHDMDLKLHCDTQVTDVTVVSSDLNYILDRCSKKEQKERAVNAIAYGNNNMEAPVSASEIDSN